MPENVHTRRLCASGSLANSGAFSPAQEAERELGGAHEADRAKGCLAAAEAWSAARPVPRDEARADGGLADGALSRRYEGPQVIGRSPFGGAAMTSRRRPMSSS